jgi:stress response protein YsnF
MQQEASPSQTSSRQTLALEAMREPDGFGGTRTWTIRLPVRAERIAIEKSVVVREEIVVHARPADRSVLIQSDTRREVLRLELAGEATAISEKIDAEEADRHPA